MYLHAHELCELERVQQAPHPASREGQSKSSLCSSWHLLWIQICRQVVNFSLWISCYHFYVLKIEEFLAEFPKFCTGVSQQAMCKAPLQCLSYIVTASEENIYCSYWKSFLHSFIWEYYQQRIWSDVTLFTECFQRQQGSQLDITPQINFIFPDIQSIQFCSLFRSFWLTVLSSVISHSTQFGIFHKLAGNLFHLIIQVVKVKTENTIGPNINW